MNIKGLGTIIVAGTLVAGLSGCKLTGQTTEVQSLDNFARADGAKITTNMCEGSSQVNLADLKASGALSFESANDEKYAETAAAALTAVPQGLLDFYFAKGGKLVYTQRTAEVCAGSTIKMQQQNLSEGVSGYISCWKAEDDGNVKAENRLPTIYFNTDPAMASKKHTSEDPVAADIHHSTVRSFAHLLSNFLVHLRKVDNGSGEPTFTIGDEDADFAADRDALTFFFFEDIAVAKSENKPYTLASYSDMFAPGVMDALLSTNGITVLNTTTGRKGFDKATRQSRWSTWYKQEHAYTGSGWIKKSDQDTYARRARLMKAYIFAEAFDSYYCSDATKAVFASEFKNSYSRFSKMVAKLEASFAEAAKVNGGKTLADGANAVVTADNADTTTTDDSAVAIDSDATADNNTVASNSNHSINTVQFGLTATATTVRGYPILRALLAIPGRIVYGAARIVGGTARAVGGWAVRRHARVSNAWVPGQPVRNVLRFVNGGRAGWRIRAARSVGIRPFQRLRHGCLIRRWRC